LEGRDFTRVDEFVGQIGTSKVVIINNALARLFWPGRSAVGQKLNQGSEIIGVTGDVRYAAIENEPVPEVYLPAGLFPQDRFSLVVRASSREGMSSAIRSAIREIEPGRIYLRISHDG
jgi:putative ABC transport system permease protein